MMIYNCLTLVSDIQMGAVCCFSSRSVTLVYQLSPCSCRVPEQTSVSRLKRNITCKATCQDVAPQFLQFLALLQQLLAWHVSLPEMEIFVMTQERTRIGVGCYVNEEAASPPGPGTPSWVFKATMQPICNRQLRQEVIADGVNNLSRYAKFMEI